MSDLFDERPHVFRQLGDCFGVVAFDGVGFIALLDGDRRLAVAIAGDVHRDAVRDLGALTAEDHAGADHPHAALAPLLTELFHQGLRVEVAALQHPHRILHLLTLLLSRQAFQDLGRDLFGRHLDDFFLGEPQHLQLNRLVVLLGDDALQVGEVGQRFAVDRDQNVVLPQSPPSRRGSRA